MQEQEKSQENDGHDKDVQELTTARDVRAKKQAGKVALRWYEALILLIVIILLFFPKTLMNQVLMPDVEESGHKLGEVVMQGEPGQTLKFQIYGEDELGEMRTRSVQLEVAKGNTPEERLKNMGLIIRYQPSQTTQKAYVEDVIYASPADKEGIYFDDEVTVVMFSNDKLSYKLLYIPAIVLFGLVLFARRGRLPVCEKFSNCG